MTVQRSYSDMRRQYIPYTVYDVAGLEHRLKKESELRDRGSKWLTAPYIKAVHLQG